MALIIDATDSNNWLLVYENFLTAIPILPKGHIPLPRILTDSLFDSHFLLIGANSTQIKPKWNLAFFASQLITIPGIGRSFSDQEFVGLGLNIAKFPAYSNAYGLRIDIPFWHKEMDIRIWKYTGIIKDTGERLEDNQIQITRIEGKIDGLSTAP